MLWPWIPACAGMSGFVDTSNVLAAVDMNLGAVEIRAGVGAQHVDDLRDFIRRAEALHRNLLDDLLPPGRQNGGVDLARRNRVHANPEPAEIAGHFARQGGE